MRGQYGNKRGGGAPYQSNYYVLRSIFIYGEIVNFDSWHTHTCMNE